MMTLSAARSRGYRQRHPGASRATTLKSRYGLTTEVYDELLLSQAGLCALPDCRADITNCAQVDHDHDTHQVRGLLCPACNLRLGHYERSKDRADVFDDYIAHGASIPTLRAVRERGPR